MTELHLPLCAVLFSLLLCIVFFSKKRLWLIENKIYAVMLISGFCDSLIVSVERILVMHGDITRVSTLTNVMLQLTNKLDFAALIIFSTASFLYTLIITYPNVKQRIEKIIRTIIWIDIIVYLGILLLDVNLISANNIISVEGSAIVATYLFGGLYLIISMLMAIFNIKRLTKRHIPIMSGIFISLFLVIIFVVNPYIMIISIAITFVNYLMFFTIENPDIQMIDELSKSKEMAEKYNNDKSKFIFNMTQQIRYPLNIIEQKAEQIIDMEDKEILKEKALEIKQASTKISNIVNGALDISTIDAKKIKIVENQYNIKNLLTEISIRSEKEAAKNNLEFRYNIESSLPEELYGDSIRLKQIIQSIITNSIKYTDKGFVELNINTIIRYDVCRLIISIRDSGRGIKTEEIDKLFSKNETTNIEEKIEEKELTLETVKKMVNIIGGTITVESEKNKGTEITIIIDQKIKEQDSNISNIVEEYKKINNKKKILFISDVETERSFYKKRLGNYYDVEEANGGEDSLKRIRNNEKFDLIILKEDMDKLDGSKVFDKMKKIKEFNIPVVLLSDKKDDQEILKYKQIGFKDIIFNDLTSKQLNDKIRNLL